MLALLALLVAGPALAQGFDPFHEARIDNRIGAAVPLDAPLLAADGRATNLRAIAAGRPLLVVPVLHHCPNLCGVTLAGLAQAVAAQKAVAGRDFAVVAFGIDPHEGPAAARDDLATLRASQNGADLTGFHAVVGSPAAIRAVTDALGYHYAWDPRINQYAHAAGVAVLTGGGRLSGWLYGVAPAPGALQAALARAQTNAPSGWTAPLLLLCYHYDASTGRYTLAITRLLQAAGIATMLALAIAMLRLRGRSA
jgi:protein SCO1/2